MANFAKKCVTNRTELGQTCAALALQTAYNVTPDQKKDMITITR